MCFSYHLRRESYANALIFADGLAVLSTFQDNLQRGVHLPHIIFGKYNCKILKKKTKVMTFSGQDIVGSKICIENPGLEQISHYKYLGCDASYELDHDMENKIIFSRMCTAIKLTLTNKCRRNTQYKFYKAMAVPTLLYDNETCSVFDMQP